MNNMPIPFNDLTREWDHFEKKFLHGFKDFGRAGIYVLGPALAEFERDFAAYSGYKYAVSVSSGLAALEIALRAHGIKAGDEVITVANSAVATALAISHLGAKPVFCDIKDDYLIDETQIASLITGKTRAILPVHLFGAIANMDAINHLAAEHHLVVVEDACQAHGADFIMSEKINTKAFSFYPTKNLGAIGEGGLILTNDEKIKEFAESYRNYGQAGRYNHVIKGDNCRLSSLQGVLLDIKLKELDNLINRRRSIAKKYVDSLSPITGLKLNAFDERFAYHIFAISVLNNKRDALRQYLTDQGVETLIHYPTPIHQQPCYAPEYPGVTLTQTEKIQTEILSLPCYPFLTDKEQDQIIKKITEFFS